MLGKGCASHRSRLPGSIVSWGWRHLPWALSFLLGIPCRFGLLEHSPASRIASEAQIYTDAAGWVAMPSGVSGLEAPANLSLLAPVFRNQRVLGCDGSFSQGPWNPRGCKFERRGASRHSFQKGKFGALSWPVWTHVPASGILPALTARLEEQKRLGVLPFWARLGAAFFGSPPNLPAQAKVRLAHLLRPRPQLQQ